MLTAGGLFLLALPISSIAWTVTHEQIFHEFHEYCVKRSTRKGKSVLYRKFFYLFTCEYCFSHYVTALVLILAPFKLLAGNWFGYVLAGFALVWIANAYMSLFALVRVDLKLVRKEADKA